jgi:hypothetical protein
MYLRAIIRLEFRLRRTQLGVRNRPSPPPALFACPSLGPQRGKSRFGKI